MSAATDDRRIRGLRPAKPAVDPWRAHGSLIENEHRPNGSGEHGLTIFLAGAECPVTCSFCDLWRWTIDGPTRQGALPKQISEVLGSGSHDQVFDRLKLYNASNFFDRRAVPAEDVPEIAALAARFTGVTVESHANTVGPLTLEFARLLSGRLEVAIGLETIHPVAGARLNKRLDLARFAGTRDLGGHKAAVLISVARFVEVKRLDLMLRAVAAIPTGIPMRIKL